MKTTNALLLSGALALSLISCDQWVAPKESAAEPAAVEPVIEQPVVSVLTAEDQAGMSPEEIIGRLKKGNENFVNNNITRRDHSAQRRKAMLGQYPKAFVLSCVDSRVPVEDVFDLGIGDVFVARVAGNIENADIVGSMEFATAVAGSKVVVVMGHTACGAVHASIDQVDASSQGMNALADLLDEIELAVATTPVNGERSSKNTEFAHAVINNNAMLTVRNIREASPKMSEMEDRGDLMIVSAVYDMESGKVSFNKD